MTAEVYAGASSAGQQWHDINSYAMEQQVFRLQTRIGVTQKRVRKRPVLMAYATVGA